MHDGTELRRDQGTTAESAQPAVNTDPDWDKAKQNIEAGRAQPADAVDALRDGLTGAYARGNLHDRLRQEVERARRYGLPLSLLVADLDHFKSINDAFGHTRGDQVLVGFVERLNGLIRDSDLLFRYGGDEFVLLLLHTDSQQSSVFARRLLDGIRAAPLAGQPPLTITLSIGSSSYPADGQTPEDLFERADQRLLEAKRQGRARVVMIDPAPARRLSFEVDSRLLERELPLTTLRQFLDSLAEQKRGLFGVHGPPGVGKTWFLSEVAKAARLRGYAVWNLRGRHALRQRLYGAIAESLPPDDELPPPAAGEAHFVQALQRRLLEQGQAGILLAIDEMAQLDRATLELLRAILYAPDLKVAGLAYTVDQDNPYRAAFFDAPLNVQASLEALSPDGLRLWLRSALRWEAPEAFGEWLHDQTDGLPGMLSRALHVLVDRNVLRPLPDGWLLDPTYAQVALRAELHHRAQPPPHNLPLSQTGFVGRDEELRKVKQLVEQEPLVVLIGPGGIGKSRLALQAAAEILELFPDGVYFVPLDAISALGPVISAMAHALGVGFAGTDNPQQQLLRHLKNKALLLVLDDIEPQLDAAQLMLDLVRLAPKVKLLITSRDRLNWPGERSLEVRGLPIPPAVSPGEAPDRRLPAGVFSAEQLFVQGARRALPDFSLTDEDRSYMRRICQLVEGTPLGIELAAAWTPLFSCREIAGQIERNLDFLATSRPDAPQRQRSARAVLDYFWSLLSDDERQRVRGLSVFRSGFEREAAQRVANVSLFFLAALVDKAFLRKTPAGRFEMHELLRQYAEAKLAELADERRLVCDAHCDYFADFLEARHPSARGGDQSNALAAIRTELGNVRAAWQWATNQGRGQAIRRSFGSLVHFYETDRAYHEGAEVFGRALEAWHESRPVERQASDLVLAELLAGRGAFLHRLGQNAAAGENLVASLSELRRAPDEPEPNSALAFVLYQIGQLCVDLGDYAQAQQMLDESLKLLRVLSETHGIAQALHHLAGLAHHRGDYTKAAELYEESLRLRREAGNRHGIALSLCRFSRVEVDLGDYRQAQAMLKEGEELTKSFDLPWGALYGMRSRGQLAIALGDHNQARWAFQQALASDRNSGDQKAACLDLLGLAQVGYETGEYADANRYYEESLGVFQALGYQRGAALALAGLGEVASAQGNHAQAEAYFTDGLRRALEIGALPTVLAALVGLAALKTQAGDLEPAIEIFTLVLYHPAGSRRTLETASRLLSQLEGAQPGPLVAAAEDRGRKMSIADVVAAPAGPDAAPFGRGPS